MIELTLLSRTYCHLCEDMLNALAQHPRQGEFRVQVVAVDADPGLEDRYGILVPVLLHKDEEICHYHLDLPRFDAFLSGS
ncbi:MAG: glutaredoxin family protein [Burkholderiales bacterium]|nr:glutaredoxin family protein [Burkholderiales bacterium]